MGATSNGKKKRGGGINGGKHGNGKSSTKTSGAKQNTSEQSSQPRTEALASSSFNSYAVVSCLVIVLCCALGWSSFPDPQKRFWGRLLQQEGNAPATHSSNPPTITPSTDKKKYCAELTDLPQVKQLFRDSNTTTIQLHHNGNSDACAAEVELSFDQWEMALNGMTKCLESFNKYDFESWWTRVLVSSSSASSSCSPPSASARKGWSKRPSGIAAFCDAGPDKTPELPDHNKLVRINNQLNSLPCRFHTREGLRLSSINQLASFLLSHQNNPPHEDMGDKTCTDDGTCSNTQEKSFFSIYAVPAGRVFMFAPKFIGETFELNHILGANGKDPISLTVMSLRPRVFDVINYFTRDESRDLVETALKETSESHRIKRSTTGASGHQKNKQRTSESGFDTHGKTAMRVKRRGLSLLGFDEYNDGFSDGLQILRYNQTKAYVPHLDWIDDPSKKLPHNYDSAGTGGNRYATLFMYMSDLDYKQGGQTVFVKAWPVDQDPSDRTDYQTALSELRSSGDGAALAPGSWEEEMTAKCRTRLAVQPRADRAILFYSQLPNGEPDPESLHGGCPVLSGTKYAANLWVWNTIRDGFPGAPRNPNAPGYKKNQPKEVNTKKPSTALFENSGGNPDFDRAELFFGENRFWAKLGKNDPSQGVNTYEGHVWTLKVDGNVVKRWNIGKKEEYVFRI